jgi:UDP-N-acetylglucosamine 1-carboxyvinyltransferase
LQPQISALLGLANGNSVVRETVFYNRFGYASELNKAGFRAQIVGDTLHISGINQYFPCQMTATDLRGGAAMVLATLNSHGQSEISNAELIERGYSDFIEKLTNLGADIKRG